MARKILLADDSVTAQNMGRRILTDAGYEVTTVNNGSAALKRIAESKPDLIVLDVYMPGYGGLEVCQRIRESEDTARIPVLLTVGKLEPFKAEDARRVRADAYVVKPFEASELLTALTKLEDKIVPPPQPHKPGRSIPPAAAIEKMSAGKSFGDAETGWKNRLTIPPPHLKSHEDHAEDSETPRADVPPAVREISQPAKERTPEDRGLPGMGDITAAEIAAIAAAAAAFSTPNEEPFVKPVWAVEEKPAAVVEEKPAAAAEPEPAPESADVEAGATFASAPEVSAEAVEDTPPTEMAAVPPVPAEITPAEVPENVAAEPAPELPTATIEPVSAAVEEGKLKHEEVAAALAALAPIPSAPLPDSATMAVPASSQHLTGPRWVAEAVTLSDDEAALILEQEMIKAQAAMAEMSAVPAAEAAPEFAVASQESSPAPEIEGTFASASPAEESAQEPFVPTQEVPTPAIIEEALADAVALQAETQSEQPAPEVEPEAAFAASAAAGGSAESVTVEAVSHTFTPTETPAPAAEPAVAQRESDLAAAWASWKQVRDSVANPQFTSQIADAAAASLSESPASEPTPSPESASAPEAHAPEETGAIASIVDSVLAELKPKLMEEIAKKIKKDK